MEAPGVVMFKRTMILLVCLFVSSASALALESTPAAAQRQKMPAQAEVDAAATKVRELFRADYIKSSQRDQSALCEKLVREAALLGSDPAAQYAMLREAIDAAARAGDMTASLMAIRALGEKFDVDHQSMTERTLLTLGKNFRSRESVVLFLESADAAIGARVAADDFDPAAQLMRQTLATARQYQELDLAKEMIEKINSWQMAQSEFLKIKAQAAKLAQEPDNPEANAAMGKYYALWRDDWAKALGLLIKSNDPLWQLAANADAAAMQAERPESKTQAVDQRQTLATSLSMKAGEAWLALAGKLPQNQRPQIARRALYWIRIGTPRLSGLEQAVGNRKRNEARQMIVGPGKPTFLMDLTRQEAAGVVKFRNKYFLVVQEKKKPLQARLWAQDRGGELASITDKQENDFVTNLLRQTKIDAWIGASDEAREGHWVWFDSTPFKFNAWRPGEPSNEGGDEDFILLTHEEGKWNDGSGGWDAAFIVQWRAAP